MKNSVECFLCPHHCKIEEGKTGLCRVRGNRDGIIVLLTYGEVAAWNLDPIEKKPLYHFYPGSKIFSVGGYGCNLRCSFCQNYEISQRYEKGHKISPQNLAELSLKGDSIGICFTYSEPLVWYEMIEDTAPKVKEMGGKVVLVSNGVIEGDYLEKIIPFIDAVNIDIKAFTDEFYKKYTGGKLQWVLDTVKRLAGRVHLEITTLVIPSLNDREEEIQSLAEWLKDLNVPLAWHLSRYFPIYKSKIPSTDEMKLTQLWEKAKNILPYVYLGNMSGGSTTYCSSCGYEVIDRNPFIRANLDQGKCPHCGQIIWGIGL